MLISGFFSCGANDGNLSYPRPLSSRDAENNQHKNRRGTTRYLNFYFIVSLLSSIFKSERINSLEVQARILASEETNFLRFFLCQQLHGKCNLIFIVRGGKLWRWGQIRYPFQGSSQHSSPWKLISTFGMKLGSLEKKLPLFTMFQLPPLSLQPEVSPPEKLVESNLKKKAKSLISETGRDSQGSIATFHKGNWFHPEVLLFQVGGGGVDVETTKNF